MKIIKKIIFLFSITYCFILQSSSKEEKTKNWYRTVLSNRYLGLRASAIIGGSLFAGLKYVFDNNKFLSSFKVAEKIKHTPHVKFVGAGMIAGVGLYELLKKLTKPKKSDSDQEAYLLKEPQELIVESQVSKEKEPKENFNQSIPIDAPPIEKNDSFQEDIQTWALRSMRNSQVSKEKEPKENFNQSIKVAYFCPGSLSSLLSSEEGVKSHTAREIENKISEGLIEEYSKNQFFFFENAPKATDELSEEKISSNNSVSVQEEFMSILKPSYAAALYLINENQRESFKEKFAGGCRVYDLYKIDKPTAKENLWCYALPLEYSIDSEGKKTYSYSISSFIRKDSIDKYCFKLTEGDAEKIDLKNEEESLPVRSISRTNKQDKSDNCFSYQYWACMNS